MIRADEFALLEDDLSDELAMDRQAERESEADAVVGAYLATTAVLRARAEALCQYALDYGVAEFRAPAGHLLVRVSETRGLWHVTASDRAVRPAHTQEGAVRLVEAALRGGGR